MREDDIQFLKDLQEELNTQDAVCQATPRYWGIMNYRDVPGHEDYDDGEYQFFYNDGNVTEFNAFKDLKEFLEDYSEDRIAEDEELRGILKGEGNENDNLYNLQEYVMDNMNGEGHFDKIFMKEEEFVVYNAMFLTIAEAKKHLELNHYHYSSKAHVFAMTAWRAPKVERLINILETFNWNSIQLTEEGVNG